ncbi:MAG: tetratricopeptide repeat protein [Gammaproteobacteria bacterium]|nr:tetratricopeptide repeat protein [Gammaproteobacteria bacterium]MBK9426986.1 tetratricopeptide repeat protein [Gammaproteobacteria bacterium]
MADYHADQEQLDALRRWWKQYGAPVALAVTLVVGGWFGWQQWQSARAQTAEAASIVYEEMMTEVTSAPLQDLDPKRLDAMTAAAQKLKSEHDDTQYAALAGLLLARLAVARDDLDAAATELRAVMQGSNDKELAQIARLRLARVLTAQEKYDEALSMADAKVPDAMVGLFAEARGDIRFLRGETDAARADYQTALEHLDARDEMLKSLLEIKLNQVQPVQVAAQGATP